MDIKGTVYALPTPPMDTEKYTKSIQKVYKQYTKGIQKVAIGIGLGLGLDIDLVLTLGLGLVFIDLVLSQLYIRQLKQLVSSFLKFKTIKPFKFEEVLYKKKQKREQFVSTLVFYSQLVVST